MKSLKVTTWLMLSGVILSTLISFTVLQTQENELIIGTWKPEGSLNSTWAFSTDSKCYQYYTGEETEVYYYSISTTSPQCGYNVDVGPNFSYLKLVNVNNTDDIYCYEILTLNAESLQIRYLGSGDFSLFERQ